MRDGDFPPKGAGQNPVFSVYVKLRFVFHWFLQQILQGKNHFYLLLPTAAYAGMSPPQGHSRAGTARYYMALSMGRVTFSGFSSVFQWLSLFCVTLMPALHLPGCQLPKGESCLKRLCSPGIWAAGGLTAERHEHCCKLMEIV